MLGHLVNGLRKQVNGLFAVWQHEDVDQLPRQFVFDFRLFVLEFLCSLQAFSGSEPGDESVDGEEGESESFLDDDDEADGLVLVLEDAGLSDEHENPADDEDGGHYQLVLEDPLEVFHIHFSTLFIR